MKRLVTALGLLLLAPAIAGTALPGCGTEQAPVNRVGVNVLEKSALAGHWYMARTTIDMDYEAAGLGFLGEIARDGTSGFFGFALPRIRWVIDEQNLYAYRDYEILGDAEDPYGEADEDYIGTPVAAFRILSHFDVRRDFNPTTGEELNVIVENSTDRRWWERRYMRVDWSRNLLTSYFGTSAEVDEVFGMVRREPASLYIQDESNYPASWRPQFHFMTCNGLGDTSPTCDANDRDFAEEYEPGDLYSFSFVTQEIVSPGSIFFPGFGIVPYCGEASAGLPECASALVSIRTSFLRVSPQRQYVPVEWTDERHERAGFFRLDRATYDPSRTASDPTWGFTDFTIRGTNRHNIWRDWYTEVRDADGRVTSRTPVPYADRRIREIAWYTTPELPAHLVRPAFETIGEWNDVLMGTVRELRDRALPQYPDVSCQTTDPGAYCFCQSDPDDPSTILNPTCSGRYDPFESPDAAASRGVVDPFDCHVLVPSGAEPNAADPTIGARLTDSSYYGWYTGTVTLPDGTTATGARMVGSECVNVLRLNSCNDATYAAAGDQPIECQERGDIRFRFLSFVDQPGTPFLGVAQLRGDPITGEVFCGDANIGGPAMNSQRTRAMQAYDLINGRLTDQAFWTGEDIRAYLEAANRIDLPAPPRIDFSVALAGGLPGDPSIRGEIDSRMGAAMERAERLQGPEGRAQIFSDRLDRIAGTPQEAQLLSTADTMVMAGMNFLPDGFTSGDIDDELRAAASPLQGGNIRDALADYSDLGVRMGINSLHMPTEYTDDSALWFVNQHRTWPRARVEIELNRRLYRDTQVHEMGHCLGLLHNFGGTADPNNYEDDYYRIDAAYPLPTPESFDRDGTPGLSPGEQLAFENAWTDARSVRERAGIDTWMNSSVMDYTAQWYERIQGAGYYDRMAVSFGYGDVVHIYRNTERLQVQQINPSSVQRVGVKWYRGGESCTIGTDSTCPYAVDGARAGELLQSNRDSGLTQHCVAHPTVAGRGVCSSFDADQDDLMASLTPTSTSEWVPIDFRYCDDIRWSTRSLPWCNQFDEGDSFRDIVRNAMQNYERNYIFSAFRRYRRTFSIGGYIGGLLRYLFPLVNIEQNLLYRYQTEPEFRGDTGAWGFYDEFLATADILNFYARILAQPSVGAYRWNAGYGWYERFNSNPDAAGGQLQVTPGLGRYGFSVYQRGLVGFNMLERIGSIYDKIITMQLLTIRGLSPFYGPDTIFYTNFYDLFPNEVNQIFTGMIADQPRQYSARVRCGTGSMGTTCRNPRILYMDFYRGDCSSPTSTTCRPHPADVTYRDELVMNSGDSFLLQAYAAIFGVSQFPVYYDTTFQTQLYMCIEGSGDCYQPEEGAADGVDFVRYTSTRFGLSYLAWQLTPQTGVFEQRSIAFSMVQEAAESAFILGALRKYRGDFGGTPFSAANLTADEIARLAALEYTIPTDRAQLSDEVDRLDDRVRELESFFGYLIQIQRSAGINFPFTYRRAPLGE